MERIVRPGLLALLAALLVRDVLSGQLLLYVNERTTWLVALSAPLLLAMALAGASGVRLGGGGRLAVMAVAVPVLVALFVPARPLGSAALDAQEGMAAPRRPSIALPESLDVNARLLPRNLAEVGLLRTGEVQLSNVDGERADLTGFVAHRPGLPADEFLVARFLMRCCTADAFAVSVPVRYAAAGELADDTWVQVEGTIRADGPQGNRQAIVEAGVVRVIPQPRQPYLPA